MGVLVTLEINSKLGNVLAALEEIRVAVTSVLKSANTASKALTNQGLIGADGKLTKSANEVIVESFW